MSERTPEPGGLVHAGAMLDTRVLSHPVFLLSDPYMEATKATTERHPEGLRADLQRLHTALVELHHRKPHWGGAPRQRPGGHGGDGIG